MNLPMTFLTVGVFSTVLIFMFASDELGYTHVVSFALGGLCLFLDMCK